MEINLKPIKDNLDALFEDNENNTYTVAILKPWSILDRYYFDDSFYEYIFDNYSEAEEFYNWVGVENDDSFIDAEFASDCID